MLLHIGQTVSSHTALKYTWLADFREIQSLAVGVTWGVQERGQMFPHPNKFSTYEQTIFFCYCVGEGQINK